MKGKFLVPLVGACLVAGLAPARALVLRTDSFALSSRQSGQMVIIGSQSAASVSPSVQPTMKAAVSASAAAARPVLHSAVAAPRSAVPAGADFSNQQRIAARGVTILIYGNDPAFDTKAAAMLDHLAALGVHNVSLTVPLFQSTVSSTDIHADFGGQTPSLANMQLFIQAAHARGMAVLVRPLLDDQAIQKADNYRGQWRGTLAPNPLSTWFSNYQATLAQFATLGSSAGLDALDIGTEFDSLEGYTANWDGLISATRSVFSGPLTYSVNWDRAYPAFGFQLDFLGIDAFFPLNAPANATVSQLVQAWQPWLAKVAQTRSAYAKPVVFTEIAVPGVVQGWSQPWNWNSSLPISLESQRLYYQASCQALRPLHIGTYWWAYYNLDPIPNPTTDSGFDPYGKPAEGELSHCYNQ